MASTQSIISIEFFNENFKNLRPEGKLEKTSESFELPKPFDRKL